MGETAAFCAPEPGLPAAPTVGTVRVGRSLEDFDTPSEERIEAVDSSPAPTDEVGDSR